MTTTPVRDWLRRLWFWDGALPLFVWSLPRAVAWLVPGQRGPIELLGVVLPVAAFIIRFLAAMQVLRSRGHHPLLMAVKVVVLFLGLFFLMMIDAIVILRIVMPDDAFRKPGDLVGFAVLYALYLAAMAFATFPGWRAATDGAEA